MTDGYQALVFVAMELSCHATHCGAFTQTCIRTASTAPLHLSWVSSLLPFQRSAVFTAKKASHAGEVLLQNREVGMKILTYYPDAPFTARLVPQKL